MRMVNKIMHQEMKKVEEVAVKTHKLLNYLINLYLSYIFVNIKKLVHFNTSYSCILLTFHLFRFYND